MATPPDHSRSWMIEHLHIGAYVAPYRKMEDGTWYSSGETVSEAVVQRAYEEHLLEIGLIGRRPPAQTRPIRRVSRVKLVEKLNAVITWSAEHDDGDPSLIAYRSGLQRAIRIVNEMDE